MADTAKKVLIVEDEMLIAATLSVELEELGFDVAGIATRAKQAIAICEESPVDIILLDIQLKGDMDGIELGHYINDQLQVPFIYLTANTDEATFERARITLPYAFITKPYEKTDLQRALNLLVSRLDAAPERTQPNRPSSYILTDRIFIRHKDRLVKVDINDIQAVKADGSYCLVYTTDHEYILTFPMKTLLEYLPKNNFLRTHRSYIVNLDKIDALTDNQECMVLANSRQVPISRRFRTTVLERLRLL